MDGRPKRGSIARRRAATAAVCSVVFAAVGGVLLATPANAGILGASDACTAPSTLVDTTGAGSGAIDLSGSSGGITLGVDCVTGVTPGAPASQPAPAAQTTSTMPVPDTSTATDVPTPEPVTTTITDASGSASSAVTTSAAMSAARLSRLSVLRSSNTVYPVEDGYQDTVRFAVHAMNASGALVPVVGSAVLTRGGTTIRTWHLDGSTARISWNGRVEHAIRTGLYTLTVSAWSADGTTRTAHTRVRVLGKHLEQRTITVRSDVGAHSVSADIPRELLKAYATGRITVRIRTVASVRGPAKLVFSSDGISRSVTLKDGTRTTAPRAVPQGFSHVTITHAWAKGDAELKSLKAIWTYSALS